MKASWNNVKSGVVSISSKEINMRREISQRMYVKQVLNLSWVWQGLHQMGQSCDWQSKAGPGTQRSEIEAGATETEVDVEIMCRILWNFIKAISVQSGCSDCDRPELIKTHGLDLFVSQYLLLIRVSWMFQMNSPGDNGQYLQILNITFTYTNIIISILILWRKLFR